MKEAYIIDGLRTAFGKFRGSLSSLRTDDLLAQVIKGLVAKQTALPLDAYEDVIIGCANQAGEDNRNVARMSLLLAGLPWSVPGETINRLCASGMSSIVQANRAVKAGDGDVFISGGIEHMTRAPLVMSKSARPFGGDSKIYDSSFGWRFINPKMAKLYGTEAMGNTAENLAELYKINREDQDAFALWSQQKAAKAQNTGRLAKEIISIDIPRRKQDPLVFNQDEFIRPDTSMEALAKLRTVFKENGTVTAGNASGLNDGAAAVIVASETAVNNYDLKPLARIVSSAVVGVEPRIMGIGPVKATEKALKKAGLNLDDMGIIELNEAFSAQSLACTRTLGLDDKDSRINPNGGAIAIGHPLGVSGTRITYSLALELHEQDKIRISNNVHRCWPRLCSHLRKSLIMGNLDINDPTDLDILRGQFNMLTADEWQEYIDIAEGRNKNYKTLNILKTAQRKAGLAKFLSPKVLNWVMSLVDELDDDEEE